jgi:hypothetical protein
VDEPLTTGWHANQPKRIDALKGNLSVKVVTQQLPRLEKK